MINTLYKYKAHLLKAFLETLDMLIWASIISIIIGISFGLVLFLTNKKQILENKYIYYILSILTNIIRSIPFILFIIIIIPFNRLILGTGFGPQASKVPLSLIGIAGMARLSEQTFLELDKNLYETSYNLGASKINYVRYFILREAIPSLILNIKTNIISILAYSTVVGVIGGGGLGYLAINEGFTNFNYNLMWIIIIIMIILVTIIETSFNILARKKDKR